MANNKKSKIVSVLLTTILVLGVFFSPVSELGGTRVYAAELTASSWAELETVIGTAANGDTIIIQNDLVADKAITINKPITIKGKDGGVTVYQKQRDAYDSMFIVDGGDLTLGANLTLSGQVIECTDGTKTLDDFATTLDRQEPGDAEPEEITASSGGGYLSFEAGGATQYIYIDSSGYIAYDYGDNPNKALFEIGSGGYIQAEHPVD